MARISTDFPGPEPHLLGFYNSEDVKGYIYWGMEDISYAYICVWLS